MPACCQWGDWRKGVRPLSLRSQSREEDMVNKVGQKRIRSDVNGLSIKLYNLTSNRYNQLAGHLKFRKISIENKRTNTFPGISNF